MTEVTLEECSKQLCHDPYAALHCLLPAACNTKRKLYMLRNLPFREILDISVYYKIVIQPNAEYGHYGMNLSWKENIVPGNLYVSTNALGWLGGADAFLGVGIEEMADANQSDIYIVPTSIHESILVPADDSTTPEDVAGICMGDGPFEKGSETWLSDNVYRYDRVSKKISVVYDAEAVKQKRMDGMELLFGPNYGVKATRHRC